ncbi:uncharacterized protein PV09_04441 [Verruconis gallopava]|uniref:Heterokaryon incompatibility domain-containing protein n=1 Tax=Verruconis gallopava TaxID=253628 RepID=A0A0D2ACS0_9PEZI|nr:uncharacterized protein PV09_04441 [Verruconis gallopava]KIW04708.1 hypothetical protein PV09_04441 [Verruconis gallopava]
MGCVLCQGLRLMAGGEIPTLESRLYLELDSDGVGLALHEKNKGSANPRLMVYTDEDVEGLYGRHIPVDPHDNACMEMLKGWFTTCVNHHRECPAPRDSTLPTRVIDVGPSNGSEQPRLLLTEGKRGQWIALSHRWGTNVSLKTTSKNLDHHRQLIEWDRLSKTFQDAVSITRLLGFRYLWIDSLCILQDRMEDWKIESVKMRDVYKNCTLNIAAAHPQSATSGILANRRPVIDDGNPYMVPSFAGVELPFTSPAGKTFKVKVQKYPQPGATHRESRSNCLVSRGWVIQEFSLSPRTVTWTEEQMTWQCVNYWAEEYDRRMFQMQTLHIRQPRLTKQLIRLDPFGVSNREVYDVWLMTLNAYLARSLTFESDALPAISGVAQEVQRITSDTYLMGHWQGDFCNGLLWFLHRLPRCIITSIAPSWSWVSRRYDDLAPIGFESGRWFAVSIVNYVSQITRVREYAKNRKYFTEFSCRESREIINSGLRLLKQELQILKIENEAAHGSDQIRRIRISAPMRPSPVGMNADRPTKGELGVWSDNCWLVSEKSAL